MHVCMYYNKEQCKFYSEHMTKGILYQHFCSYCMKETNKKYEHPLSKCMRMKNNKSSSRPEVPR